MRFSAKTNIAALGATIIVNAAANILPLGGMTTGQVSANYNIMLTPAPVTFSIWSVIYALLLAVFVIELIRSDRDKTESGILDGYFMLSCAGNIAWILSWHLLPVQLSFFVILTIFYALYQINSRISKSRYTVGHVFKIALSMYFGWITVATLVNFCVFGYSIGAVNFFSENDVITIVFIGIAAGAALYELVRRDLAFYAYTIAWALLGMFFKMSGRNTTPAIVALGGCVVVTMAALGKQLFGKFFFPSHRR